MKKIICILTGCLCINFCALAGGGWPQPKGGGYFKLSQGWIVSSSFYGPGGETVDIITNGIYITSVYGEYGFTNRLTGIAYVPFFVRSTLNEIRFNQSGKTIAGDELNATGDAEIALKYGIITDKPVVLSATLLFGLPLGTTAGGDSRILQTGDGEFNQLLRVDVSHSFSSLGIYVSAYAALNNRTRNFSDEYRFGAEVGGSLGKLTAIAKVNMVRSFFNGDGRVAENGVFSNNTEYISPSVEFAYDVSDTWGVSASGAFALSGRNILAAPFWNAGIYIKLNK